MPLVYNNRLIINQRGGSIDIDNSTEREKVKLSHRSGSNVTMTNVVNSELATNNKQITVVNDSFETVGSDKTSFTSKNYTTRTGENVYRLNGFINQSQLDAFTNWKVLYGDIALVNSEFKINRAGEKMDGKRAPNPVIGSSIFSVDNTFGGYTDGAAIRSSSVDEVATNEKIINNIVNVATEVKVTKENVEKSCGGSGSSAPGVMQFGAEVSAATEGGEWTSNEQASELGDALVGLQYQLTAIEQNMGHGGDEISFTKRNRVDQVGATFNDYSSIRIDEFGRSQPLEVLVSDSGVFKNHDYVPHIEEVDNSSNFPGGNDDKIVCNRYSRTVGSGGINLKTTGVTELGGATLKAGYQRINLNASHGIQVASEAFVEIQSLKTITLRTNRQVYVDGALGVMKDVIVGGSAFIGGELYANHITGPIEVQQTEDTTVFGKFATDTDASLVIGWCHIGGARYPVFGVPDDDIIVTMPHKHHFNNIALRLMTSNKDLREIAQSEGVNDHSTITQALPVIHGRKNPHIVTTQ